MLLRLMDDVIEEINNILVSYRSDILTSDEEKEIKDIIKTLADNNLLIPDYIKNPSLLVEVIAELYGR